MSLPREWSLNNQQVVLQQPHNFYNQHQEYEDRLLQHRSIDNELLQTVCPAAAAAANVIHQQQAASSQEMLGGGGGGGPTVISDENMNQHVNQLGSLFSIHSAPVYDACNAGNNSPKSGLHYLQQHHLHEYRAGRPASLVLQQTTATSSPSPIVPPAAHQLSPPEILAYDDEDNDNLLTISSLTARPLIAESRGELGCKTDQRRRRLVNKRQQQEAKRRQRKRQRRLHKKLNFEPLDGGYGWVVVFGAFFVQFWVAGLVKSYGLLYVEVMETFTDSSAAVASWIPAILSCLCLALGEDRISIYHILFYTIIILASSIYFIISIPQLP